ncbi:MAG: hypothetical protein FWH05_00330 [Oscillospiraceae bacterium]|nr:hypothetical protein [Oscillospiraceae bacterium]
MKPTEENILYTQINILTGLFEFTDITKEQFKKAVTEHDVIGFVRRMYGLFHEEGIMRNMYDTCEYLKNRGITVNVVEE